MLKWNKYSSDRQRNAQHEMAVEQNGQLPRSRSDSWESDEFNYDDQSETTVGISIQKTETSPILGQGLLSMNANYRSTINSDEETIHDRSTTASNSTASRMTATGRNVIDRLSAIFPSHRFQPTTPLQHAMRRSRRLRYLRSASFWSMFVSLAILVSTVGYYCFTFIGGYNAIISTGKNGYKIKFEKMPSFENTMLDVSKSATTPNLRANLSHQLTLAQTWMFGYSTRTLLPATTPKQHRVRGNRTGRYRRGRTARDRESKRVMVNLVTRQFADYQSEHNMNSNSNTSDIDATQQQERPNPAVYGWTPSAYPNPRYDPLRCGVSYIIEAHIEQNHIPGQDLSTPSPWNMENGNINVTAATQAVEQPRSLPINNLDDPTLRLCDPDWMLGGALLEEVADAMYNFSSIFGSRNRQEEGDWDVAVSGNHDATSNVIKRWFDWIITKLLELGRWTYQTLLSREQAQNASQEGNADQVGHSQPSSNSKRTLPPVELAVATVRKMNLLSVLRQGSYYAYEDQDDMVSDAAQIFARTLHDAWWSSRATDETEDNNSGLNINNPRPGDYGILLFLSIQDRICFISTGSGVQHVLPWWRLDHIVASMKPDLRHQQYGTSIVAAIQDLTNMLLAGPPSLSDRFHDFVTRFGVVIAFAAFTFVFGAWGEYRDRKKRWQYAEQRSKLSDIEKEKALRLQKEFKTKCCPICLDSFDYGDQSDKVERDEVESNKVANDKLLNNDDNESEKTPFLQDSQRSATSTVATMMMLSSGRGSVVVDEYGVPLRGADGKKIKILRCGHIFCDTCWKHWVHSGCGNPCNCPVCRQDVGRSSKSKQSANRRVQRLDSQSLSGVTSTEVLSSPLDIDSRASQDERSTQHHRNESDEGLSTIDSNPADDSILDTTLSASLQTTSSMTLDMPLVGGGPSFLLFHANPILHHPMPSAGTGTEQDGERTPLLSRQTSTENYTNSTSTCIQ